jgi:hypothetical protein
MNDKIELLLLELTLKITAIENILMNDGIITKERYVKEVDQITKSTISLLEKRVNVV